MRTADAVECLDSCIKVRMCMVHYIHTYLNTQLQVSYFWYRYTNENTKNATIVLAADA